MDACGWLTDYFQMHLGAQLGLGGHLALVPAGILRLHILDLKWPSIVVILLEYGLKTLVRYERGLVHADYVPVLQAHPRDGLVRQSMDLWGY